MQKAHISKLKPSQVSAWLLMIDLGYQESSHDIETQLKENVDRKKSDMEQKDLPGHKMADGRFWTLMQW